MPDPDQPGGRFRRPEHTEITDSGYRIESGTGPLGMTFYRNFRLFTKSSN
jgi:hypothetical protein